MLHFIPTYICKSTTVQMILRYIIHTVQAQSISLSDCMSYSISLYVCVNEFFVHMFINILCLWYYTITITVCMWLRSIRRAGWIFFREIISIILLMNFVTLWRAHVSEIECLEFVSRFGHFGNQISPFSWITTAHMCIFQVKPSACTCTWYCIQYTLHIHWYITHRWSHMYI